jgi:hypothetical protein
MAAGLALTAWTSSGSVARAQDAGPGSDKSRYNLINPTPRALMREMATDRPDVTESPYTVDAGHVQVESSFLDYTRDDENGGDLEAWSVLPTNVKIGLTNYMDLQLAFEPYIREELENNSLDGFGATQLRLKINLWGNDGGHTALAIMPFVQFPTESEHFDATEHLQGGVILPLKLSLPREWDLGLMAEFDVVRDAADEDYELQFVHTASLSHAIVGDLDGYLEYIGITDTEEGTGYLCLLGTGVTYGLSDNVQVDGGANIGLSGEADDFTVFVGVSVRQ